MIIIQHSNEHLKLILIYASSIYGLRRQNDGLLVSLLMSAESNSGAADAAAAVTWPGAEVAARLNPGDFRTALLCSRALTRASLNWMTASWHRVLCRLNDPVRHC